jgi:DNA invertase Pin-like site-specific DNA recombinase
MKRAYSLVRYSSDKQKAGDSRRRQMAWSKAWCERNRCLLDESLHWDRPVSAFRGANRSKGALAAFLEMVKVGRVPKGSILLVESLDRLSREEVDEALTLFLGILKAGIDIVTMVPERHYTKAAVGDIVGILEPLIIMSRAHEESLVKAERLLERWNERRKRAREEPMTSVCPAWLRLVDGRWHVIKARAAVVRRIFRLSIDGHGLHVIAHILNREKVPPMGRGKEWFYSYVGLILRNRAVLGECQPHTFNGKRSPVGKPVPNYYPAIVSEATFHQAGAALDARKNSKGPRGKYVRNLFTGLLRDARDGCTLVTTSESDSHKTVKLVSSGGQRGRAGSTYRTFPYEIVEGAFLQLVKELKASDILPRARSDSSDEVAALSGRLQELEHQLNKALADLKAHGEFDTGMRLLRELEDEKKGVALRLEKAKAAALTNEAEVLGETQSLAGLLADAEGEERLALRTKIKARIAQLVGEMRLLVVVRGRDRLGALQLWFRGGERCRNLFIFYRGGRGGGQWWARSFAAAALPEDLDLRSRADAQELEALLSRLDRDAPTRPAK